MLNIYLEKMKLLKRVASSFNPANMEDGQRKVVAMISASLASFVHTMSFLCSQYIYIENAKISPLQLLLIRKIVALVMSVPYFLAFQNTWKSFTTSQVMVPISISSLANYLASTCTCFALLYVSLAETFTLLTVMVFACLVLSRVVLKESIMLLDGVFAAIAFVGVILITQPQILFGDVNHVIMTSHNPTMYVLGVGLVLAAALCNAMSFVSARLAYRHTNWTVFLLLESVMGVIATPLIMYVTKTSLVSPSNSINWVVMLNVGVTICFADIFMHYALTLDNAVILTVVKNFDVAFGILFQSIFFHIRLDTIASIGTLIVISSITILTIVRAKRKSST